MHPDPLGGGLADERFGDLGEASGIGEEVGFGVPGPIDRDLRCDGQVQSSVDPVYGHGNTGSVGSLGEEGGSDRGRGRVSEEIDKDRLDRDILIDEQAKEDIVAMEVGLDALKDVKPATYKYKEGMPTDKKGRTAGLMAQDLEHIPGAVSMGIDGYRRVDPYPVLATVVQAVKELDARTGGR